MRLPGCLAAAAAALLAVAAPVAAASTAQAATAGPVLTLNALAGPPAVPGDTLVSSLTPGTLLRFTTTAGGSTGLFCQQSKWQAQLLSNPAVPGPATSKLVALAIAGCVDNNPTVTGVVSVAVGNLPQLLQVTGSGAFPIQILPTGAPLQIIVNVTTTGGAVSCVYQAGGAVNGNTGLGSVPWVFTNQPFKLVSGPLTPCGSTAVGYLTASYSPVIDATAGGAVVYVN
jgi:hypothetical protein